MKKIYFATGNDRKMREARAGCDIFGIKVEQLKLDIDEIQAHDPKKIAIRKAEDAFRLAGHAVVVGDSFWSIPALNGFPGGYMKDVMLWFSSEDFINLVAKKDDKRISFTETIVYKDDKEMKVFSKEYFGKIVAEPRGKGGNSIEKVAEFNGATIAEQRDKESFCYEPEDYIWNEFAEWFSSKRA